MERQKHGFDEERYIKEHYSVDDYDDNYTSQWDGIVRSSDIVFPSMVFSLESLPAITPVSIKTKKINCAVEMGDLMRNAKKQENFLLTVGFWEGRDKAVVQRHFIYVPQQEWLKNFPLTSAEKMNNIFKDNNITNNVADDLRWKQTSNEYKEEWNKLETGINVHFKRDHKNQRRVQCSLKKDYFMRLSNQYSVKIKKR